MMMMMITLLPRFIKVKQHDALTNMLQILTTCFITAPTPLLADNATLHMAITGKLNRNYMTSPTVITRSPSHGHR